MRHEKKRSLSRSIGYLWTNVDFKEAPVEKLLEKAVADGVVVPTQFDTGRGNMLWLHGYPGPRLRDLRDKLVRLIGAKPISRLDYYNGAA